MCCDRGDQCHRYTRYGRFRCNASSVCAAAVFVDLDDFIAIDGVSAAATIVVVVSSVAMLASVIVPGMAALDVLVGIVASSGVV